MSKARKRALTQLRQAEHAVAEWVEVIRQTAETRVGSAEPDAVITDPSYEQALDLFDRISRSVEAFSARAWLIERQAEVSE